MQKKTVKSKEELIEFIKTKTPAFYFSSQTSTVIPYDKIEKALAHKDPNYTLVNLAQMPAQMDLLKNNNLLIKGAISWKEAREFLKSKGRNIMTAPTEDLALVSAGAATSCTGERSFSFGNFRSQIKKIKYINHQGDEVSLSADKKLEFNDFDLSQYQADFKHYENFKNAPYPRFEFETDLLVGTEGQLGIITEIEIETCENHNVNHLFILLDKWEENPKIHFDVQKKIQSYRNDVIICELIDSNAFSFLKESDRPNKGKDAIFFEVKSENFEEFYEKFIMNLEIDQDEVFESVSALYDAREMNRV
jgi:glycolate oxidase